MIWASSASGCNAIGATICSSCSAVNVALAAAGLPASPCAGAGFCPSAGAGFGSWDRAGALLAPIHDTSTNEARTSGAIFMVRWSAGLLVRGEPVCRRARPAATAQPAEARSARATRYTRTMLALLALSVLESAAADPALLRAFDLQGGPSGVPAEPSGL